MSLLLYRVLAASGGYVNGLEVVIGSEIPLTLEEARYEVDAGNVLPTGKVPPLPPALAPVQPGDLVAMRRGLFDRLVDIAALEAFLAREGGALDASIDTRGDEIGTVVAAALDRQLAAMETLTRQRLAAALDPILAGASPDLVTFAAVSARLATLDRAAAGKIPRTLSRAARDPTTGDIPPGEWLPWTNTATGRTSLWENRAGVMVDLLTFSLD